MRLFVTMLVALLVQPALAGVEIEHDETADFSRYRTYAWKPGTDAERPEVQGWVVAAVERELGARGLRLAGDTDPDLYVVTHVFKEIDGQTRANYFNLPRAEVGVITSRIAVSTKGVLIIDLIDGQSGQSVWQGLASEVMAPPKPAKLEKKIDKAARRLLRDFPPD